MTHSAIDALATRAPTRSREFAAKKVIAREQVFESQHCRDRDDARSLMICCLYWCAFTNPAAAAAAAAASFATLKLLRAQTNRTTHRNTAHWTEPVRVIVHYTVRPVVYLCCSHCAVGSDDRSGGSVGRWASVHHMRTSCAPCACIEWVWLNRQIEKW